MSDDDPETVPCPACEGEGCDYCDDGEVTEHDRRLFGRVNVDLHGTEDDDE